MSRNHLLCRLGAWTAVALVGAMFVAVARSQQPPEAGQVQLTFAGEVKLQVLVDYISQRLDMQFIYDADVANRKINIRAPKEIPVETLPAVLGSVLRMEGLALVDADIPGWKRIVDVKDMPSMARPAPAAEAIAQGNPASPVTQAFILKHASATQLAQVIRPFMTQPGSNVLALEETNVLIVTDYASTVLTIEKLIEMIDQPRADLAYEYYQVTHATADELAETAKKMLAARIAARAGATEGAANVEILAEPRTNQIVIAGPEDQVNQALDILKRLDVSLDVETRVYHLEHVQAERFDRIVKGFLGPQRERLYQSSVDEDGNLVIVSATAEIHGQIDELVQQIDAPVEVRASPIRIYKLKNAHALDVLYSLLALQEVMEPAAVVEEGGAAMGAAGSMLPLGGFGSPNTNTMGAPDALPSARPGMGATQAGPQSNRVLQLPLGPEPRVGAMERSQTQRLDRLDQLGQSALALAATSLPGGARVSADVATNSLIIVAPPEAQAMYASLIESLDQRRPQVLIEAKIVAVDTTDNFQLGVEVSGGDRIGAKRLFAFTSYGLSEINPVTGALQIIPGNGFNGTMVDPQVADVVIRALTTHSRARVLAAPRILVNDNSTGQLESVLSVPFESVNASETVSTTSLGGDQQAGTIITVTPHISENDHLLLEFAVEFSTFAESSANDRLPPPRQIDRVESMVTIPDGQTVIVGGLKRIGHVQSQSGLPYVEFVPLLQKLTGLEGQDITTTSFFLFIRPVILRDDKFADLKYLSEKSTEHAQIPGDQPPSAPIMIE